MAFNYNPANWYWTPPSGQDGGEVYSSAAGSLIPVTNSAYVAWIAGGNAPQNCPVNTSGVQDWADLDLVLTNAGLPATGLVPPTQAQLQASLTSAISTASDAVTAQILPTTTQLAALINAAIVVAGNGGSAPSTGTFATNFSALSASYGAANIAAFANFIDVGINESLALGAAERVALAAIPSQTTGTQLATILSTFETALAAVVTALNAVLPAPIVAPAAISIKGVNA